ncbi:MAG TPA: YbhB/YbcL family Raf kinase inhibitor-like protein [Bryobacteraceae bacterium]|nr:YbhB/YbcL family Raf kinase inhibitor-like protein [Bryobacteraceae bacterium]
MRSTYTLRLLAALSIAIGILAAGAFAQDEGSNDKRFQLHSTTFRNDSILPIITINNIVVNGKNSCSINGAPGGNKSPELSWSGTPPGTRSFVVTLYDATAAFTHWGMYNISGDVAGLPMNAGVAGSSYGAQIVNDFYVGAEYDGPCPPANVEPFVHHYVFTVYALDTELDLPSSANFPANAETLYQALIEAGKCRHILASASLTGLYSTTKPSN